jgi:hypothetical protein
LRLQARHHLQRRQARGRRVRRWARVTSCATSATRSSGRPVRPAPTAGTRFPISWVFDGRNQRWRISSVNTMRALAWETTARERSSEAPATRREGRSAAHHPSPPGASSPPLLEPARWAVDGTRPGTAVRLITVTPHTVSTLLPSRLHSQRMWLASQGRMWYSILSGTNAGTSNCIVLVFTVR